MTDAFDAFKAETNRPTLIIVDSIIGFGAPNKAGTHSAHGEPLGVDEIKGAKRSYGWPEDEQFLVPDGVKEHIAAGLGRRGAQLRAAWDAMFTNYAADHPELAAHLEQMQRRQLPDDWDTDIPVFPADQSGVSGRDASGKVLNAIACRMPCLIGGSADLTPPTSPGSPSTGPVISNPVTGPAGTFASGSGNTPPERSRTGWHCPRSAPTRRVS